MKKQLTLTAALVAGVIIALPAQADHPNLGDRPRDCGHYCNVIDDWLDGLAAVFGLDSDRSDVAKSDARSDRPRPVASGSDSKTDFSGPPSVDYPIRGAEGAGAGRNEPPCLGCGGLPTVSDLSDRK